MANIIRYLCTALALPFILLSLGLHYLGISVTFVSDKLIDYIESCARSLNNILR